MPKKRRTPAQIRATKKLVALNKRRAKGAGKKRKSTTRKKRRTPAQIRATKKLVALNKRRAKGAGAKPRKKPRRKARKKAAKRRTKSAGTAIVVSSGRRTRKARYIIGGKKHNTMMTPKQAHALAKKKGVKAKRAKNQKPRGAGATRRRKGNAGKAIVTLGLLGAAALGLGYAANKM